MTIFGKAGPLSTLLRATLHSSFGHSPLFFGPNKGGERLALGCSLVQTTTLPSRKIYFRCNNATFATVADNQPVTRGIMVAKVAKNRRF